MMRRNVISLVKFFFLGVFTVFLTVIIFRYIRRPHNRESTSPQVSFALIENGGKLPMDLTQNFNKQDVDEKIDWHNYKQIKEDAKRSGTGEQGKPAFLSPSLDALKEKLYKTNGFNAALSDEISLNRSIPDIRHSECKKKKYLRTLDPVSVIILVDDASTKVELKNKLDDYVKKHMPKVKIIRLPKRSGLIRGRLAGAKKAVSKILVFLDSHSETNVNWLPPLLEPIAQDYKTCVCPFIDVIAYETFEYRAQDEGARGAFDWELYYKRLPLLPEDLKQPAEPFKSPVMAGGLFAISAKFFWELGGYDSGLDIWGGEQYELSFKIWQCGGQMYDAPCSRVGHIYRKFPPFPNPGRGDFLGKNYKRVAEVWMDEYAEYIYRRRPHLRSLDPGNLTEQRKLRKKLHCKPFKWFMENIAFDLVEVYPPIEPDDFASGEIRNMGAPELCLDAKKMKKDEIIKVDTCKKDNPVLSGEQEFKLTWHKDIRPKDRTDCLDVSRSDIKAPVSLYPCHGKQGNQLWRYDVEKQWLMHGYVPRCLDTDPGSKKVYVTACDQSSPTQKWRIENVNMKAINNWENVGPKLK
ncbi:N-acetylgalactosaminyltransferase 6-like isoform X2 [Vespa velutina]|uniref:N-acetylgalactosaminyltransferase 6-like isoform X2 n=1 Tax=Vespa velutina TaxID=202808 RepID=UPI001FB4AD67|nr:N-acetylgalactosaminyltransferase 6-like isoform X2 [Vespa velutina]